MESNSILFSIIVPTYNRSGLLCETIRSVIVQTYSNWELIIIDDGGTDNTQKMVSDFNDERIHYFWQENAERGAARNAGVQKANGDYVFFLDSDDFILPNYLEYADQLINEKKTECLHIPYLISDGKRNKNGHDLRNITQSLFESNKIGCQIILRKDIALEFSFSQNRDLKVGEDWLLVLQLTVRFKWLIGSKKLGRVRLHTGRTMYFPTVETIVKSKAALKSGLAADEKLANHPTLFQNIDFEFNYLEISALIHEFTPKNKIRKKLGELISAKPQFLFSKRFLFVLKHLLLLK